MDTREDDLTVLEEVLKLHDLQLDQRAGGFLKFEERSRNNFKNRCLHHHVFDLELLEQICLFFKLKVLIKETKVANHIVVAVR
jgi:hypothetical protein